MAKSPASMLQNAGKVKFDPPKVPVIFVLGKVFFLDYLKFYCNSIEKKT